MHFDRLQFSKKLRLYKCHDDFRIDFPASASLLWSGDSRAESLPPTRSLNEPGNNVSFKIGDEISGQYLDKDVKLSSLESSSKYTFPISYSKVYVSNIHNLPQKQ